MRAGRAAEDPFAVRPARACRGRRPTADQRPASDRRIAPRRRIAPLRFAPLSCSRMRAGRAARALRAVRTAALRRARVKNYFDEAVAARYDEGEGADCDPAMIEFLEEL